MRAERISAIVARVVVGGIFVYAGAAKVGDTVAFAGSIASYDILPYFAIFVAASVLPWLEIVSGGLLVVGVRFRGAATLLFLLDVIFMVALASALVRGLDIDCGCFRQGGGKTSPWVALARDTVILGALVLVLKSARRPET